MNVWSHTESTTIVQFSSSGNERSGCLNSCPKHLSIVLFLEYCNHKVQNLAFPISLVVTELWHHSPTNHCKGGRLDENCPVHSTLANEQPPTRAKKLKPQAIMCGLMHPSD